MDRASDPTIVDVCVALEKAEAISVASAAGLEPSLAPLLSLDPSCTEMTSIMRLLSLDKLRLFDHVICGGEDGEYDCVILSTFGASLQVRKQVYAEGIQQMAHERMKTPNLRCGVVLRIL